MLPQKRDKPQIAHQFPSHAVAVLPWMAPEILRQVRSQRESKPTFKTVKTRDVGGIHESLVLPWSLRGKLHIFQGRGTVALLEILSQ